MKYLERSENADVNGNRKEGYLTLGTAVEIASPENRFGKK